MPAKAGFANTNWAHINLDSNIKDMRSYIKLLRTKALLEEIKVLFESGSNKNDLFLVARQIVKTYVYDVYPDPGTRTYNLLDSFTSGSETIEEPNLVIYSDSQIAESKYYSDLSYAAFFEEPVEFRTFITPRGEASPPKNYRPFFAVLEKYVNDYVPQKARNAFLNAMFDLMPPSIVGKIS